MSGPETSALSRYYAAVGKLEKTQAQTGLAADARARALADLHDLGWSYQRIAETIGITRARVQQLVERGRTA